MRIGIDLDGVTVNYIHSFSKIMHERYGCKRYYSHGELQHFDWSKSFPTHPDKGELLSKELFETKDFFFNMPSIPTPEEWEKINAFIEKNEVFFITHRDSFDDEINKDIIDQSVRWLAKHGVKEPNVILICNSDGKTKGDYAKELNLDAHIDDGIQYLKDIHKKSPSTVLFTMPWNYCKWAENAWTVNGITDMIYFLENVDQWKQEHQDYLKAHPYVEFRKKLARFVFDKIGYRFYNFSCWSVPFLRKRKPYMTYGCYYGFEPEKCHHDKHVPHKYFPKESKNLWEKEVIFAEIMPEWFLNFMYKMSDWFGVLAEKIHPYWHGECEKCGPDCTCVQSILSSKMNYEKRFPSEDELIETKAFLKHRFPLLYKMWDDIPYSTQFELCEICDDYEWKRIPAYTDGKLDVDRTIDYKILEGYAYCSAELNNEDRSEEEKESIKNYLELYEEALKEAKKDALKESD